MEEKFLQTHPATRSVPIFDETDWIADFLNSEKIVESLAEASDTIRMHDLLHRNDYRPIAAVRTWKGNSQQVRLFFQRRSSDDLDVAHELGICSTEH